MAAEWTSDDSVHSEALLLVGSAQPLLPLPPPSLRPSPSFLQRPKRPPCVGARAPWTS